jgi:hypothetical protein
MQNKNKIMKKILITFTLLLITAITFAQDKPFYMRAESFEFGTKDSEGNITWNKSEINPCDNLIKLEDKEAVIYSSTKQIYHVISYDGKEDGVSRWYCTNDAGSKCNLYLSRMTKQPGKLGLIIEFSDYVWCYVCTPTNN